MAARPFGPYPLAETSLTLKSAIFNLQSLITVLLLLICACTYLRAILPALIDRNKQGIPGLFWKCARIGERLSLWVSFGCFCMAAFLLFF
ncbi:unnamed protein product [Meloidogyne enterolobii]|uniref:Uncharacterized protein n=1 Tax=Meloidogyne enterolobii TaxID=390850 RepID=A0ACB0YK22_MELEN